MVVVVVDIGSDHLGAVLGRIADALEPQHNFMVADSLQQACGCQEAKAGPGPSQLSTPLTPNSPCRIGAQAHVGTEEDLDLGISRFQSPNQSQSVVPRSLKRKGSDDPMMESLRQLAKHSVASEEWSEHDRTEEELTGQSTCLKRTSVARTIAEVPSNLQLPSDSPPVRMYKRRQTVKERTGNTVETNRNKLGVECMLCHRVLSTSGGRFTASVTEEHALRHTVYKRYGCSACINASYRSRTTAQFHIRKKHPAEPNISIVDLWDEQTKAQYKQILQQCFPGGGVLVSTEVPAQIPARADAEDDSNAKEIKVEPSSSPKKSYRELNSPNSMDPKQFQLVLLNRELWQGPRFKNAIEPDSTKRELADSNFLQVICNMAFNCSITDLKRLNTHYRPFSSEVYGETKLEQLQIILDQLDVNENDVFVDLGSGVGTLVIYTAGATKIRKAVGIEKATIPAQYAERLGPFYRETMTLFNKYHCEFELLTGDFLDEKFRKLITEEATIVFINNFAFTPELENRIKNELISVMQQGTRIISSKPYAKGSKTINLRRITDVEALLDVTELKTVQSPTSWTDGHVPFYLHTVNQQRLIDFFNLRKSPRNAKNAQKRSQAAVQKENKTNKQSQCIEDERVATCDLQIVEGVITDMLTAICQDDIQNGVKEECAEAEHKRVDNQIEHDLQKVQQSKTNCPSRPDAIILRSAGNRKRKMTTQSRLLASCSKIRASNLKKILKTTKLQICL